MGCSCVQAILKKAIEVEGIPEDIADRGNGASIKGRVKRKDTSPWKKINFFSLEP